MKRNLKKVLLNNAKPQITYTERKLGSSSQIKEKTIYWHRHGVIYHGKRLAENCVDDYTGKAARRTKKRIVDHTGRDTNSHLLQHSLESGHKSLEVIDYEIISTK